VIRPPPVRWSPFSWLAVIVAALAGAAGAVIAEARWWRVRSSERLAGCPSEQATRTLASRPPRAPPQLSSAREGLAALAEARARVPSAGRLPLELPELDELQSLGLDDRSAKALEHALMQEVGARVYARPRCLPAERDRTEIRIAFQIEAPDEQSGSAVLTGTPEIASGAPLDPTVVACVGSRLGGVLSLRPDRGERFLAGFSGKTRVMVRLP
jgi:hypothetical protein